MNLKHSVLLLICFFAYSCTVSIDGAPCNPEENNCPNGQYCSEEGICKRGNLVLKDISEINDIINITDTTLDSQYDILEDVITEDIYDSGADIIIDSGCKDECISNTCKDDSVLLVCKDWDNDSCKENKEMPCGGNSKCRFNTCVCEAPFKDCNNDMSDGCEANIKEDPENCNSCGNNCGDNSLCNEGVCACKDNYMNCNGKWSDGCEINLNANETCGTNCQNIIDCSDNAYCNKGGCICNDDYANCDNSWSNGCEANLSSDINNCGICNKKCSVANGIAKCENRDCAIASCNTGYKDCYNGYSDGCETNIYEDLNNCGSCGKICQPQNVNNEICNKGECTYDFCKEYFIDKDLDKKNGCEYWTNFPKRYDNQSYQDIPVFVLKSNGTYIIGGATYINGIWLMAVDKYGEIIWQRQILLKGSAVITDAIERYDDNGYMTDFVVVGTLQNASRVDTFILGFDGNGLLKFARNFYIQGPNEKLVPKDIKYIKEKNVFIIVGSYNDTPLFMKVSEDGDLIAANRYDEELEGQTPIPNGTFVDSYQALGSLYLIANSQFEVSLGKGVSFVAMDYNGNISAQKFYNDKFSTVNSMVFVKEMISSPKFAIVGKYIDQMSGKNKNLIITYDFTNDQNSIKTFSVIYSNIEVASYLQKIDMFDEYYVAGGIVTIGNGNEDVLLLTSKNMVDITLATSIGGSKSEILGDLRNINQMVLFVAGTNSFSSNNDFMSVILTLNEHKIVDANCDKSFKKQLIVGSPINLTFTPVPTSMKPTNIITLIKADNPINQNNEAKGVSYNICGK